MALISDSTLCNTLGFDLDAELSNIRRYAKTAIKYVKNDIQTSLDALSGEILNPLQDITDAIDSSINEMLQAIEDNPLMTAAEVILSCITTNLTFYNYSMGIGDWKSILDNWLFAQLDIYLSVNEKLLWDYLGQLDGVFKDTILNKIFAFAACLIGCPGVVGSITPGPDGWGYITSQGWVYISEVDFTNLINTVGIGSNGKTDFTLFGGSGTAYGTRIRTIQDKKNNAVNALASVATGSVTPDPDSQQILDDYSTLVSSVDEVYEEYQDITLNIIDLMNIANSDIKEVDLYITKVYKYGNNNYKNVADSGKTKMILIYTDIESYYASTIANDSAATIAYSNLDLTTLQALIVTNTVYLNSTNSDKNRIKLLKNIVRDISNALQEKGTIGGEYSGGIKIRGRAPIKEATGTGSYQEEINNV
jgi:hypothetical protein